MNKEVKVSDRVAVTATITGFGCELSGTCEVGEKKMLTKTATQSRTPVKTKAKNEAASATQRKEMSVLDFFEKYLPNYYSSNDIARWDDLTRYMDYEMPPKEQKEKGLYDTHYHQAFFEYEEIQNKLFEKAFSVYTHGEQKLTLSEFIKNYFDSRNEDRKKYDDLSNMLSYDKPIGETKYKNYNEVFSAYLKITDKLFNAALQEREQIMAQKNNPSPMLEQLMKAAAAPQRQQPTATHPLRERSERKV